MKKNDIKKSDAQNLQELDVRMKEISNEMLEIVEARNKNENRTATISPPAFGQLTSANIRLWTEDDKDIDTLLVMWLEKPGSVRIAECLVSKVWFPNNSLYNFQFSIFGSMSTQEAFGSRLWMRIERQDGGKDSWYYQPYITLEFNDGTKMAKEYEGSYLNQGEQNVFVI